MGKHNQNVPGDHKSSHRISSASRKLAARRRRSEKSPADLGGVPHIKRETKCKPKVQLEPLPNNISQEKLAALDDEQTLVRREAFVHSTPGTPREVLKPIKAADANMSKPSLLDDNVFTFRPKVSTASAKIVENMGTDFMARQQQHLDKQKKFVENVGYQFKSSPGHLSPLSQYKRLKERGFKIEENDNTNVNANSQECEAAPPDTPSSKTEGEELTDSISGLQRTKTSISTGLQRILDGPYANGNPEMVLKHHKSRIRAHHMKGNKSVGDSTNSEVDSFKGQRLAATQSAVINEEDDLESTSSLSRSKTMPSLCRPKLTRKITNIGNTDRLKNAKELAEKAIKMKKVFTIQGGYSGIRHSLRKRGWVEKFYRIPGPQKTKKKHRKGGDDDDSDDDDDDDDDDTDSDNDQPKVAPWEEEDGIYGIMSRIVRNVNPTFIWVLKRDVIDYRFLTKDQMVNHYCKAGSFTTKVGLCVNMRQVPWFDESDPDEYYPRCYRLSHEEEKAAFIDDYRLTTCINVLKAVTNLYMEGGECSEERREQENTDKVDPELPFVCTNPECTRSRPNNNSENMCIHATQKKLENESKQKEKSTMTSDEEDSADDGYKALDSSRSTKSNKKKKRIIVPQKCLDRALIQCDKHLNFRNHDDIDQPAEREALTAAQWDELISWYYQLVHEGGIIPNVPANILGQVENVLNRIKALMPQFDLDGQKNIWIVKPGAKSRGRGIVCYDRLEEMLKLVNSQVVRKDNKYVVQKYMERPLLIHNVKFDIRQWFLVTDWNPLTIYFYQDSYLRFCSQQFTLDDYDESIHLSNNAIQKNYKNASRSNELPDDNMWTHLQFKDYIRDKKLPNYWDECIYPGMKKAIICALLSTQDLVEYRKSSFELYGADFMLTEDYKPWLIEVNSSPSMESSTEITSRLCRDVLEDTLKVALDRKFDRNCDIGKFELAYKQPLVTVPPYIGISLCTEGQAIKKPGWMTARKTVNDSEQPLFSPRKEKQVIFNDKLTGNTIETSGKSVGNLRRPQSDSNQEETVSHQKLTHGTLSAPVKKSVSRETNDTVSQSHVKQRKHHHNNPAHSRHSQKSPHSVSNSHSNTTSVTVGHTSINASQSISNLSMNVAIDKSTSDSNSVYSQKLSEQGRGERMTMTERMADKMADKMAEKWPRDTEEGDDSKSEKRTVSPGSPTLVPKTSIFGSGAIPTTSYVANISTKKMVSRTSVSTNYSIPNMDKDRPALSVNNVETTDLKTLKAQAKGVCPLTENTWARTCLDCGNGMNLHLDNVNPFCKCRQDGIRISPDPQEARSPRAKSARNLPSRAHSRVSPRPPSASACSNSKCTATQPTKVSAIVTSQGSTGHAGSKKVLLRYTDGGIQRPITPQMYMGVNSLPRLVRRYIGRRVGQYHELSVSQNSAIFIDTSQLNGALSIVSHGFCSK